MVKTSVIIPVYNTSIYLKECIDSVFNQTQKDIEVIAIDDGSTDDSLNVLKKMQKKYPQLIVMTQKNHKQGYTRNIGIEKAKGEYIYFLDSDDYIAENTLESCYICADKNKLDVVLFDAFAFQEMPEKIPMEVKAYDRKNIIKEIGEVFSGLFFLNKYYREVFTPSPCLLYCSSDFLRRNQIKFLTDVYYEDNEFHCKIMLYAERIMYIPEMFYQRRCRDTSTTGTQFDIKKAEDYIKVIDATVDLQTINHGKGKEIIKQIVSNSLVDVASRCNKYNLYCEKNQLSEQILRVWIKLQGCYIDKIESLEDINFVRSLCELLPQSGIEEQKKQINLRWRQLLTVILDQLPLNDRNKKVAIYGCGDYTDKFLKLYREVVGTISADIIFLDSYIKDRDRRYNGFPVYNICVIQDKSLDCILISSPRYEAEMLSMVREYCKDNLKTLLLYGDLGICL